MMGGEIAQIIIDIDPNIENSVHVRISVVEKEEA
jgi:hypothetical protein